MAITLRHLCKYANENYKMIQICGEANMNNLVNWVHMLEDPETAYFLHGQELIFTTGIARHDLEWFLSFAEGLVKSGASGWVINTGHYIEEVPEAIIKFCEEREFPLFTIPWETRIVDITNDFCHKIVKAEESEVSVASAFRNAIFFPNNTSHYKSVLEGKGFNLEADYSLMIIEMAMPEDGEFHTYEKIVRMHLSKIFYSESNRFGFVLQDKFLLVVMQGYEASYVKSSVDKLIKACNYGGKQFKLNIGYSSNEEGIGSLPQSYRRAVELLKLSHRDRKALIAYEDIGVLQLLIEIEDKKVMQGFYDETLGILVDYDEKHESDYCYILKCYLDNNNSVEKVAKETYVHRNTINYKIKKIKEILEVDLTYEEGLKLLLAYYIKSLM